MKINFYYKIAKKELFPLCRSLTGSGNLKTLLVIKKYLKKLKINKVKSGKKVFDWEIPSEWNIKKAQIIDKFGKKIVDFKENNLRVLGYSKPINSLITKSDLLKNIYTLPKQKNAIPYNTSYYKKRWGFCLTEIEKNLINKKYKGKDKFRVIIDSNFKKKGNLRYGEYIIKGKSSQEILISTYICHPSMANDNLSGVIVSMALISHFIKRKNLEKTIRFLFIPETIGSIAYIDKYLKEKKSKIIGGYNLSCIGDEKAHSVILTKYKNSISDKTILEVYKNLKIKPKIYSFLERGSDERQFNSPGVNFKITGVCRSKYARYPEYHTSLDNFKLVTIKGVKGGYVVVKKSIEKILKKTFPICNIICEPQLGKRGLYPTLSTKNAHYLPSKQLLNFLQYSDGNNDLDNIAKFIKLNKRNTIKISKLLERKKLINC